MDKLINQINSLGSTIDSKNVLVDLDPDVLVGIAKKATGLTDFGEMSWYPDFYKFATRIDRYEKAMVGRLYYKNYFIVELQNRLTVVEFIKKNPHISGRKILSPILIMGNPRSGTSIFYELLARGPGLRAPLGWEMIFPAGFSGKTDQERISIAEGMLDLLMEINPTLKQMHEISWNMPTENFITLNFDYHSFGEREISRNWCNWLKTSLQILQGDAEGDTWVIKHPAFMFSIDELVNVFPNAKIIHMHRDPYSSMGSLLSILGASEMVPNTTQSYLAEMDFWAAGCQKVISMRKDGRIKNQIIDVSFEALMADPAHVMESVFRRLGVGLTPESLKKMTDYLEIKPRHRYGKYQYSLEDHGFHRNLIGEKFKAYIEYYSIPERTGR